LRTKGAKPQKFFRIFASFALHCRRKPAQNPEDFAKISRGETSLKILAGLRDAL
jgi:hypothetical protein